MIRALVLVLLLLVASPASPARASVEQRCTDLGANCMCSEPLQMTALAGPADIGLITSTTVTTVSLYEAGMVFAYIPGSYFPHRRIQ